MLDLYSTSADIAARRPTTAVLGIGAVEQHGPHLPINTDWLIAEEVSRRVAERIGALLLPAIPFSMSECHGSIPGTVWLKPETLAAVVRDIVESLKAQGICHLLIINTHGGNFILGPLIQDLNTRHPDFDTVLAPPMGSSLGETEAYFENLSGDVHAGEGETSVQLYLSPGLVRPFGAESVPAVGQEFLDYTTIDRITHNGIWGNPAGANAAKGERFIQEEVDYITRFARRVFGGEAC
jgi:creatinine amidohydrolase